MAEICTSLLAAICNHLTCPHIFKATTVDISFELVSATHCEAKVFSERGVSGAAQRKTPTRFHASRPTVGRT